MATDLQFLPARFAHASQTPDAPAFLTIFTLTGSLTDHGAQIHVPHAYLIAHHRNWNGAHTSFTVTVDPSFPIYQHTSSSPSPTLNPTSSPGNLASSTTAYTHISFRTINKGIFANDLPRRKATGKRFDYSGVVDLVVETESGLVVKADERLRVPFEISVAVGEYIVIGPETQKRVQALRD